MHDTLLKALIKGVCVMPLLLVYVGLVSSVPLNLLPAPQGSLDSRLEVFNALLLKEQIEALHPFLLARVLPLDLKAFSSSAQLSTGLSINSHGGSKGLLAEIYNSVEDFLIRLDARTKCQHPEKVIELPMHAAQHPEC